MQLSPTKWRAHPLLSWKAGVIAPPAITAIGPFGCSQTTPSTPGASFQGTLSACFLNFEKNEQEIHSSFLPLHTQGQHPWPEQGDTNPITTARQTLHLSSRKIGSNNFSGHKQPCLTPSFPQGPPLFSRKGSKIKRQHWHRTLGSPQRHWSLVRVCSKPQVTGTGSWLSLNLRNSRHPICKLHLHSPLPTFTGGWGSSGAFPDEGPAGGNLKMSPASWGELLRRFVFKTNS